MSLVSQELIGPSRIQESKHAAHHGLGSTHQILVPNLYADVWPESAALGVNVLNVAIPGAEVTQEAIEGELLFDAKHERVGGRTAVSNHVHELGVGKNLMQIRYVMQDVRVFGAGSSCCFFVETGIGRADVVRRSAAKI